MPEHKLEFGGGVTESIMHPLVLGLMLIAVMSICIIRRRYVAVPILLSVFLIPSGQQLYIGGVHWLAPRLIVMAGLCRVSISAVTSKRPFIVGGIKAVDYLFATYVLCQAFSVAARYGFGSQVMTSEFGFLIDFFGAYILCRALFSDVEEVYVALKCFAAISVILAIEMLMEQRTGQNWFGMLGGVSEMSAMREGRIRSQAVFQHALTAGAFGSTLLPLMLLLAKDSRTRIFGAFGILGATVITICSNSSTPLLTYTAGLAGLFAWPLRRHMRIVRRTVVSILVVLHFAMNAPVWFLIARIDLTGGSSGFHRAQLVDVFINHFPDWWLVGTSDTWSWGWDLWDQQNQFVSIGENGGLAALLAFIVMIVYLYRSIGLVIERSVHLKMDVALWLVGCALFAHLVAFFGVNYFDQVKITWFVLLAIIVVFTVEIHRKSSEMTMVSDGKSDGLLPERSTSSKLRWFPDAAE